ncbi:hypothetical protein BDY17DRAFT_42493 [Neohortaea acidophila]|uniref:Uncharacterized protein n=1 Tax=Neohortaea acidophila TaxID=245834 RepID=A0A6A6PIU0_9PEZI|nr:uncharacterized protein BDY17DRAFT_42493 [Neohortaea acidophila]KAF2479631.1 hypothetical protein BDY17DRAFT_42493 [Neohortaea acidophila]
MSVLPPDTRLVTINPLRSQLLLDQQAPSCEQSHTASFSRFIPSRNSKSPSPLAKLHSTATMPTKKLHSNTLISSTLPPPYAPGSLNIDIDTEPSTWGPEHLLPKKVGLSLRNNLGRSVKQQRLKDHRTTNAHIKDVLGVKYDKIDTNSMSREQRGGLLWSLRKAALMGLLYAGEGPMQVTHPEEFDVDEEEKWLIGVHKKFLKAAPEKSGCGDGCEDDEDDEEVWPTVGASFEKKEGQDFVESDSESEDGADGNADAEQEVNHKDGADIKDRVKVTTESKGDEWSEPRKRNWGVECKPCTRGFGMMVGEEGDSTAEDEQDLGKNGIPKIAKMAYESKGGEGGLVGRNRKWGVECKPCTSGFGMMAAEEDIKMGGFY